MFIAGASIIGGLTVYGMARIWALEKVTKLNGLIKTGKIVNVLSRQGKSTKFVKDVSTGEMFTVPLNARESLGESKIVFYLKDDVNKNADPWVETDKKTIIKGLNAEFKNSRIGHLVFALGVSATICLIMMYYDKDELFEIGEYNRYLRDFGINRAADKIRNLKKEHRRLRDDFRREIKEITEERRRVAHEETVRKETIAAWKKRIIKTFLFFSTVFAGFFLRHLFRAAR